VQAIAVQGVEIPGAGAIIEEAIVPSVVRGRGQRVQQRVVAESRIERAGRRVIQQIMRG
jgi:hypothetical protein